MIRRREVVVLLLVLAAAALARLPGLSREGLWVDEAYTVQLTRGSIPEILRRLEQDDAPPLFYFLEKGAMGLAGRSEAGARALPLAAGIALAGVAYALARRHLPGSETPAAVLFAFSAMATFYSRQARSYSFLHLLALLLLWAALELRRRPTPRNAALFGAAGIALLYTHNVAVLLLLPAIVPLAALVQGGSRRLAAVLALVMAAAALPWAVRLLHQAGMHQELNAWMGNWWKEGRPLALAPLYSWAAFTNAGGTGLHPPIPLPVLPAAAAFLRWPVWLLAAAGLGGALLRLLPRGRAGEDRVALATVLLFAYVPLAGLVAISLVLGPAYVVGRTDTLALPGFLLAVSAGLARLRPRWLPSAAAVLWIAAGALSLAPLWSGTGPLAKRSDRELGAKLATAVAPGDALVLGPLSRPTAEYYGRRTGWWERLAWAGPFPSSLDLNPAALVPTPLDSASTYFAQAVALRKEWERRGVGTIWLLAVSDRPRSANLAEPWPFVPMPPPPRRKSVGASEVSFPMNLALASLVGLRPVEAVWEYRQDWVSGDRYVLRVDRSAWIPLDSLPGLEVQR